MLLYSISPKLKWIYVYFNLILVYFSLGFIKMYFSLFPVLTSFYLFVFIKKSTKCLFFSFSFNLVLVLI